MFCFIARGGFGQAVFLLFGAARRTAQISQIEKLGPAVDRNVCAVTISAIPSATDLHHARRGRLLRGEVSASAPPVVGARWRAGSI